MDTKEIKLLISFGLVDQKKAEQAAEHLNALDVLAKKLGNDADELRRKLSLSLERPAGQKDALQNQLNGIEKELKKVRTEAEKTKQEIELAVHADEGLTNKSHIADQKAYNWRDIGEKVNQIGQAMANAGQGITNSLMGSVNAYIAAAGQFDAETQRWNQAQQEIEKGYARIGAIAIDKLTPALEAAGDFIDKLASFLEKNPDYMGYIAKGGIGLAAIGQITAFAGQMAMIYGTLKGLGVIGLAGAPAATSASLGAMAIAAAPYVVAALLGVGVITLILNAIDKSSIGQGVQDAQDKIRATGKAYPGIVRADISIPRESNIPSKRVTDPFASANIDTFIEFEKQKAEAASQYGEQVKQVEDDAAKRRLEIIQNFADRAVQAESSYQRETASAKKAFDKTNSDAAKAFSQANTQALNEYNKQRADATAQFNLDEKRTKQDHQQEMLRLEDDHNGRVKDLVASRDALGLAKENESYAKQRGSAESDFSLASERRKQDFQQQLSDMASNYQEQRSQRAQEYAAQSAERINVFVAQQAERAQAHAQEMATLQKEKTDQLNLLTVSANDQLLKLRDAYLKQSNMMQTAFIDRLNSLSKSVMGDTAAFQKNMLAQSAAFEALLRAKGYIPGYGQLGGLVGPPAPRADGGSVLDGMAYLVGEQGPELFMSPRDGKIIPAGLTADLLNPRYGRQAAARNMTVKIESSSLTMTEILSEMDRRFDRFERGLAGAFA